jgi:thiol:disulfide interchange protein
MHFVIIFLLSFFSCFAQHLSVSLLKTSQSSKFVLRFDIQEGWHLADIAQNSEMIKFSWPKDIKIQKIIWPKPQKISTPFGEISGYEKRVDCVVWTDKTPIPSVSFDISVCSDKTCEREHYVARCQEDEIVHHEENNQGLLFYILLAFLGGIILNFMPCVFPVLSLKIFSLLKNNTQNQKHRIKQGLSYTGGVLLTFGLFATMILISKNAAGLGFHFQSPYFVKLLVFIFLFLGLNLLGVFEMGLTLTRIGIKTSSVYISSFLEGVLITIVSTPCTGPFLGTALASTLSAPKEWVFAIFISLGFGVSFPFFIISWFPWLQNKLPKPGNWMVVLKQFFGFCLLGTVVWLLSIYIHQTKKDDFVNFLWSLFFVSLCFWLYGASLKSKALKWIGCGICFSFFIFSSFFPSDQNTYEQRWKKYNPQLVEQLIQQKKPYFIDFTAKWCLICQVNKKRVLQTKDILSFFEKNNITCFEADYTSKDPVVEKGLKNYKRAGVPTYIIFDGKNVRILDEILTQDKVKKSFEKQ